MEFRCEHCGAKMKGPESKVGEIVDCLRCEQPTMLKRPRSQSWEAYAEPSAPPVQQPQPAGPKQVPMTKTERAGALARGIGYMVVPIGRADTGGTGKVDSLPCQQCGGEMVKTKKSEGNAAGIALALIVLLIGLAVTATGVGAIIGIPMMICALFMGGKRRKLWRCSSCECIIERG